MKQNIEEFLKRFDRIKDPLFLRIASNKKTNPVNNREKFVRIHSKGVNVENYLLNIFKIYVQSNATQVAQKKMLKIMKIFGIDENIYNNASKTLEVKNNNIYIGGVYCTNIEEHSRIIRGDLLKYSKCIKNYTNDSYELNEALRGCSELSEGEELERATELCTGLFELFDKVDPFKSENHVVLYRGLCVSPEDGAKDLGFMSCSSEYNVIKEFAGASVMVIILLPNINYKLLPVQPVSYVKNEWEVILAPGRGEFVKIEMSKDDSDSLPIYDKLDLPHSVFVYLPRNETGVTHEFNPNSLTSEEVKTIIALSEDEKTEERLKQKNRNETENAMKLEQLQRKNKLVEELIAKIKKEEEERQKSAKSSKPSISEKFAAVLSSLCRSSSSSGNKVFPQS